KAFPVKHPQIDHGVPIPLRIRAVHRDPGHSFSYIKRDLNISLTVSVSNRTMKDQISDRPLSFGPRKPRSHHKRQTNYRIDHATYLRPRRKTIPGAESR
ncbi:MAG TPA: hypothetical protein VIX90_01125, partial [Edaphobacter sp.]